MSATSDRELARHWREWADDTGQHVVRTAELRAQGIGDTNMRTLLSAAFAAGWRARQRADLDGLIGDALEAPKLRRAVREAIELLQEAAK